MNRRGEKPDTLEGTRAISAEIGYQTGHGDVTRFDKKKHHDNRDRRERRNKR